MRLLSGDQRGFVACQPDGKSGLAENAGGVRSRRCSGWRLVGTSEELSIRIIQMVVIFALASTVVTVYTTRSPSGEICGSATFARRRMSAAAMTRRDDCACAAQASRVRQSAAASDECFFMVLNLSWVIQLRGLYAEGVHIFN